MTPDYLDKLIEKNVYQVVTVYPFAQLPLAKINLYVYGINGWEKVLTDLPAVIGKQGVTLMKREGDHKTPFGLYALSLVYGYHSSDRVATWMPYRQINREDKFIDDVNHQHYNQWISGITDADSYEIMLREDGLYELGVIIDYNMHPIIPGLGSAIFLHVWRNESTGTEGCVATSVENLRLLVSILDAKLNPHVLILGDT